MRNPHDKVPQLWIKKDRDLDTHTYVRAADPPQLGQWSCTTRNATIADLSPHVPQVSDVGGHGFPESVQVDVLHAVLLAHLLDDGGDRRVVVLRCLQPKTKGDEGKTG